MSYGYIDNHFIQILDDILIYNEKEFKKFNSIYIKKEFKKDNNILFRCKNYRKNQLYRKGKGAFCNAQILMEINIEKNLNKFKLLVDHSNECICQDKNNNNKNYKDKEILDSWENYKNEILNFLDETDEENRKILHEKFLDFYNKKNYEFTYDKYKMNKLYNE